MSSVFTLDGVPLEMSGDVGFRVMRERGWYAAPSVAATVKSREGAHGGVDGVSWRGPRTVTLGGVGRWVTPEQALEAVDTFLGIDPSPGILSVTDELGTREALVRLASEPYIQWITDTTCTWDVGVVAPDHRKFGPAATYSAPLPGDTLNGLAGAPISANPTLAAGESPSPGSVLVYNTGTAPADPLVRLVAGQAGLTGPIEVLESGTGRRLTYEGNIGAGEFVELDASSKSVLLNGYANRRELMARAQWWQVPKKGVVSVSWTHNAGPNTDARLEVVVRPSYY